MNVPSAYHQLIDWIHDGSGLSSSLLHVHAGMLIFLLVKLVQHDRRGSLAPLLFVLGAELSNEVMDWLYSGSWRSADTLVDIMNTMFWPSAVTLVTRYRRKRWTIGKFSLMNRRYKLHRVQNLDNIALSVPASVRVTC